MSLASEIAKAEGMITKLIKDELRQKGLVDTGKLVNSISTNVTIDNNGQMDIKVSGEDYFSFLDEQHNITDDAFNSSEFNAIEDVLSEAYGLYLESKLEE